MDVSLCRPHQSAGSPVSTAMRSRRVAAAVLSVLAGCVAVAFVVAADAQSSRRAVSGALLEYYQPWQAPPTPVVNAQQLVSTYAQQKVRSEERGIMHALYRSANGDDAASQLDADVSPLDPAVAGAPSYASELNFLQEDLPSHRSVEGGLTGALPAGSHQQLSREQEHESQLRGGGQREIGREVLEQRGVVKAAEQLQQDAPPGYHLAWIANDGPDLAKENGGRDELPYFPMPPLDEESRPDQHVEWVAPGPCMLRDGTDMQYDDAECQHHQVVDDHYPDRPLATSTFPSDAYRPDIRYPYIKGPYYTHLVDGHDHQYQGYQRGHWVWKPLGKAKRAQPPPRGSYAEWFADFRNPNNDGRYGQGYGQDGR